MVHLEWRQGKATGRMGRVPVAIIVLKIAIA
jgi:hypothetical protein